MNGIIRATFTSGVWTAGTQVIAAATGVSYFGVAVDWTGYSFSATGANGAQIFACTSTVLVTGADNGTSTVTTTTLRTISGFNAFRQLAFSPIKQTISIGAATPATHTG